MLALGQQGRQGQAPTSASPDIHCWRRKYVATAGDLYLLRWITMSRWMYHVSLDVLYAHSSIASGRWGSSQLCLLLNPSPSLGAVDFLDRGPQKFLRFNLWLKRKMVGTNGHKISHVEYLTILFFWVVTSGNQTGEWKIHKNDVPLKLELTPPIHNIILSCSHISWSFTVPHMGRFAKPISEREIISSDESKWIHVPDRKHIFCVNRLNQLTTVTILNS